MFQEQQLGFVSMMRPGNGMSTAHGFVCNGLQSLGVMPATCSSSENHLASSWLVGASILCWLSLCSAQTILKPV